MSEEAQGELLSFLKSFKGGQKGDKGDATRRIWGWEIH